MFTETEQGVYSREECIEDAATALAECWRAIETGETTTAPAVAGAA